MENSRDWAEVDHRIRDYVANGGYDDAEEALAAAELVAAGLGRASPRLKPELAAWSAAHEGDAQQLRFDAVRAAKLVLDASELNELWAEADEGEDWRATVEDLLMRLQA